MKKILLSLVLCGLATVGFAQQSATPTYKYNSLLSGYNVFIYTNGFSAGLPNGYTYYTNLDASVGFGTTNVEFTTLQGNIVYSWMTNIVGAGVTTNSQGAPYPVGDAFKIAPLMPDVNGDYNANAALFVRINYTNDIPIAVTNSQGQYFPSNWVYQPQQFPNWMQPGNTNVYPNTATANSTNTVTIKLYAIAGTLLGTSIANQTPTLQTVLAESTATFSAAIVLGGGASTGTSIFTNLPTTFLQHARYVYATVNVGTNATYANGGQGAIINQMAILQPQP